MVGTDQRDNYVGHEAQAMRGVLNIRYPIENGAVTDWDDMEKLWNHAFYDELSINPEEHPVLLTEAPLNPTANREGMIRTIFEQFHVPAMYISYTAPLALYATGKMTGCVLDSGDSVTSTVPVYEGYSIPHAIGRINFAGRNVTEFLSKRLLEKGYDFNTTAGKEKVREVKESLCSIALDFDAMYYSNNFAEDTYELPDGSIITTGKEIIEAPEIIFQPNVLLGKELGGIHDCIFNTICKVDLSMRRELMDNLILAGGNTLFTGIEERLTKELALLSPLPTKIIAPNERIFSVWIGGSILSSLSTFESMWIRKEEYEEIGVNIVHRKCKA